MDCEEISPEEINGVDGVRLRRTRLACFLAGSGCLLSLSESAGAPEQDRISLK